MAHGGVTGLLGYSRARGALSRLAFDRMAALRGPMVARTSVSLRHGLTECDSPSVLQSKWGQLVGGGQGRRCPSLRRIAAALILVLSIVYMSGLSLAAGRSSEINADLLYDVRAAQAVRGLSSRPVAVDSGQESEPTSVSLSGSACFVSLCLWSGCIGSGCIVSGCLGSMCTNSGCMASICAQSGCVSACDPQTSCPNTQCGTNCNTACIESSCQVSICGSSDPCDAPGELSGFH